MELKVDSTRCQGHGQCAAVAPELFELDADGYARVRRAPVSAEDRAAAQDAEVMCPEQAIVLADDEPPKA